jgi:hypothetical protein
MLWTPEAEKEVREGLWLWYLRDKHPLLMAMGSATVGYLKIFGKPETAAALQKALDEIPFPTRLKP